MDNNFVNKYIDLVRKIVHSFKNTGIPFEDLLQEGLLGLCEAHNKYDETRGATFSTFATHCVKNKLLSYILREKKQNIAITNEAKDKFDDIKYTEPQQIKSNAISIPQDMPEIEEKVLLLYFVEKKTLNEISDMLCISREKTRQIKQKAMRRYKKSVGNAFIRS